MILTPIPRDRLAAALDRFAAQLDNPAAHAAFARIRATSPERASGEADEAEASLLGILWEAALSQPALASFLDQNWLEGLERAAARHFSDVFGRLRRRGVAEIALPLDRAPQHAAL